MPTAPAVYAAALVETPLGLFILEESLGDLGILGGLTDELE